MVWGCFSVSHLFIPRLIHQLTQKIADPLSRAELGDTETKNCAAAVQSLLQQLQDVITKLSSAAVTPNQRATIKRYQEILTDLKGDFDKAVLAYQRAAARHELLGDAAPNSAGNEKNDAMDSLLRERNHINNSLNTAAGVIGQAEAVRSDLHWQGRSLRNTGGLMGQIAANVPGINTLIDNIRRKRLQDDKIVAVTVSFCVVFTLWYIFG